MKTTLTPKAFGKFLLWSGGLAAALMLGAFVFISMRIGSAVRQISATAVQKHPGDRVEALMQYVEDTDHSFRDRNRAVWTLGQLGDRRALPVLRKYYKGGSCNHSEALCQRELGKAIKLVNGGVNITAFVWRHSSATRAGGATGVSR
jgi:hypothetical protein